MKKLIIRLFVVFFILLCFSCSNDDNNSKNTNSIIIKEISGISHITEKSDEVIVYCVLDDVVFSINGKNSSCHLTEDKTAREINGRALKLIKVKPFLVISYDDCPA